MNQELPLSYPNGCQMSFSFAPPYSCISLTQNFQKFVSKQEFQVMYRGKKNLYDYMPDSDFLFVKCLPLKCIIHVSPVSI